MRTIAAMLILGYSLLGALYGYERVSGVFNVLLLVMLWMISFRRDTATERLMRDQLDELRSTRRELTHAILMASATARRGIR